MKPYLRQTVFFIFLGVFILCSCNKENITKPGYTQVMPPPPPPPPPALSIAPNPTDTTGGTIFSSLTWEIDSLDLGPPGYVYVAVYPSKVISMDSMVRRPVQIFIQLDSSTDWIYVPLYDWYGNGNNILSPSLPSNNGYIWYFPSYPYVNWGYFEIDTAPQNYQLVDKPVKVKVKIL